MVGHFDLDANQSLPHIPFPFLICPSFHLRMADDASLALIIESLSSVRIVHYIGIGTAALLLYDLVLCLPKEIEFVWSTPSSLPKALYFIVRYLPIPWAILQACVMIFPFESKFCIAYVPGLLLAQTLTYIAATWLLCIRVLVLYPSNRRLSIFVYSNLIVAHVAIIAVGVHAILSGENGYINGLSYTEALQFAPRKNSCALATPRLLGIVLLFLLPLEVILVGLQLKHCIDRRQLTRGVYTSGIPLLDTFYQDGAVYFIFIFAVRLTTGILLSTRLVWPCYLLTFIEYSFTSIAISRLFIHLRVVVQRLKWDISVPSTQARSGFTGLFHQPNESALSGDPFQQRTESTHSHHIPLTNSEHWSGKTYT